MKRHLEAKVLRIRGGHAMDKVLKSIQDMDDATAEQWFRLLQNLESDTETDATRKGARQPWKAF